MHAGNEKVLKISSVGLDHVTCDCDFFCHVRYGVFVLDSRLWGFPLSLLALSAM